MNKNYALLLLTLLTSLNTIAQNGNLDTTFGTDGKEITLLAGVFQQYQDIKVLSDDKILVGGNYNSSSSGSNFIIAKYNKDGGLDSTFGDLGIVRENYGFISNTLTSITILANSKILVVGSLYYDSLIGNDFIFARYNEDGSLDNTFGINGFVICDFQNRVDVPYKAVELSDGSIIVTGESRLGAISKLIVAKFTADMNLDLSFGSNGYVLITNDNPSLSANGRTIFVNPDNKILIGGNTTNSYSNFTVWRFNSNGILDTSFGSNGKAVVDFFQLQDNLVSMNVSSDGTITLVGGTKEVSNSNPTRYSLARLDANGNIDTTFGTMGKATFVYNQIFNEIPFTIIRRKNNDLVVGGWLSDNGIPHFGLLFLKDNGVPDSSYGEGGWITTSFNQYDYLFGVSEQSDGKIIASGSSLNISPSMQANILARYSTETSLKSDAFSKNQRLSVYPNPVIDELIITSDFELSANVVIRLCDSNGKVIAVDFLENIGYGKKQITLNNFAKLSNGIYFMSIVDDNQTYNVTIIK